MKNLKDATERICELKGSLVALDALVPAVLQALGAPNRARLMASFDANAEAARSVMLHADISDVVLSAFERDVTRHRILLQGSIWPDHSGPPEPVDALLLMTTRITTFSAADALTSASGFFYRQGDRLHLVTSRHVLADVHGAHRPDRVEFGLHTDLQDLTRHARVSLPLFREGQPLWRQASDEGEAMDVAALEIPPGSLPADVALQAFEMTHLEARDERPVIGDALTIVGFPLGFHDTVHHLAVAHSASMASAYGVRFQGRGCFLTDAPARRGSSGSPVVRRRLHDGASAPSWQLIGVHSTRMDRRPHDPPQVEPSGLSCAWYADALPALTGTC